MMMHRRRDCLQWAALAAWGAVATPRAGWAQTVAHVAAASNLKFALDEVAQRFEQGSGHRLRITYGASGHFYAQIMQGAPFHLFMSADEWFVHQLHDAGKTLDLGRVYAHGRIGVIVPKGSRIRADAELRDVAAALRDGRLRRFAIANPAHAPYGVLAREALQKAGLWDAIQPRLVYGENVSQAAQFATSGATDGGIIAYSLALAPAVAALGEFALIAQDWHRPLAQRMVLMRQSPVAAQAFYDHLATPDAQAMLARHGFAVPAR